MRCVAPGRLRIGGSGARRGWRAGVWVPWVAAALLAAGMFDILFAQALPPSSVRISFTADRSVLTVGDLVTLTLEVTHPADHAVVVPRLGREWGPFEVLSQTPAHTVFNGDGTRTTRQQLEATLFAPGAFETPDLPLAVRRPDGSTVQVSPPPVSLTLNSVLPGTGAELKDIRSPADLSTPLWEQPIVRVVAVLACLAALAALGALGYLLYRRSRRPEEAPAEPVAARPPREAAMQELDRIERLDLPGDGQLREHYTLIADAVRVYVHGTYLEGQGHTDGSDMTVEEIVAALWRSSLDYRNARLVISLLQEADLVKFAGYAPPLPEAYQACGQARNFVEATWPTVEEERRRDNATAEAGSSI